MKVTLTEPGDVKFDDLSGGGCFRLPKGIHVYMKLATGSSMEYNSVKLDDGNLYYIELQRAVIELDVEAVAKEDC